MCFGLAPVWIVSAALCLPATTIAQRLPSTTRQGPVTLSLLLEHLAQESNDFRRVAPSTLSEETLEQRSRPNEPNAQFQTHEVISEYGFASLADSPNAIHEVRKVVSVDGKPVMALEKARRAMTLGLKSPDDKLKKRLLEDFEKHGLHGAATDFGQIILLFSARRIKDYEFQIRGERQIGADRLVVISYTQKSGDTGLTVFVGNAAKREPLHGEISFRKKDLVPLRITMTANQTIKEVPIKEESTVDYKLDPEGCVLPVSVVHREFVRNELLSENTFTYAAFRKILAGSEVKLPRL
jgi:hypothetical protein